MTWLWASPDVMARAVRSLFGFAVGIAALTLTFATLLTDIPPGDYATNLILADPRHHLLQLSFFASFAALALAAVLLWRRGEAGLEAVSWWARLLAPVATLPFVVALSHRGFGSDVELAVELGAVVVVLERLMRLSLGAWAERPLRRLPLAGLWARLGRASDWFFSRDRAVLAAVVAATAAHAVFLSLWAVWSHQRFTTWGFDLGQYHQLFETTLHGRFLAAPAMGHPEVFGDLNCSHSDFIIFALLPFYALHQSASTVLVLQSVLIALGAIPTYLFARHFVPVRWAFVLGLAWLAYPPMAAGQLYDFHTQPMGAAFAIWAVWALAARRNVAYWVFFALAISAREDVSMGLAMLGVFLVVVGQRVRLGLATAAIAGAYFVIVRFVVMPNTMFSGSYIDLAAPGGNGFGAILETLLSNPGFAFKTLVSADKLRYFFQIFAPMAFLPVRRLVFWLLLVASFILTLLTTAPSPMVQMTFQYVFNWVPYTFPLCAVALSLYGQAPEGLVKARAALVALVVGMALANLQWGAYSPARSIVGGFVPVPFLAPSALDRSREEVLERLMAKVPPQASLCSSDRLQPHTTTHLDNWSLKTGVHDCTYLIWSDWGDQGAEHGAKALADQSYEQVAFEAGVHLAKKKGTP